MGSLLKMEPMKKPFFILFVGLYFFTFSCSKSQTSAKIPTPVPALTPSSANTMFELSLGPTPTETPEPPEYVIDDLQGTVLILEDGETQPVTAEEEETLGPGDEVILKAGSQASLTLDENTMFHLSENSDVKVDQLVRNDSNGFISHLKLVAGKILSEVEKLQETKSIFEVESGGVVCGVRGTAFEVQMEGGVVHTSTFQGVVLMRNGDEVRQVEANQHVAFNFKRGLFLPKRRLNPMERGRYRRWLALKPVIQRRQRQRAAFMASLPPRERREYLQRMGKVPRKDRLKTLHQMYREKTGPNRPHEGNKPLPHRNQAMENRREKAQARRQERVQAGNSVPKNNRQNLQKRREGNKGLQNHRPSVNQRAHQARPKPSVQNRAPGKAQKGKGPQGNNQKKDKRKRWEK
jgi:hypothetical protein